MERQESNTRVNNEPIILRLSGINKNWIRHKGEWVDMDTLAQPKETKVSNVEIELDEDNSNSTRRWWKFWKK